MPGDFQERTRRLEQEVGNGPLVGSCYVNQAYAQIQHENLDYHHDVGQAKYLGEPVLGNATQYVRHLAANAVTEDGSHLVDAMIGVTEDMSYQVETHAPIDTGELYRSGNPRVFDNGTKVYDRPPQVGRIDE